MSFKLKCTVSEFRVKIGYRDTLQIFSIPFGFIDPMTGNRIFRKLDEDAKQELMTMGKTFIKGEFADALRHRSNISNLPGMTVCAIVI
jgi:hypothetical protein